MSERSTSATPMGHALSVFFHSETGAPSALMHGTFPLRDLRQALEAGGGEAGAQPLPDGFGRHYLAVQPRDILVS